MEARGCRVTYESGWGLRFSVDWLDSVGLPSCFLMDD